MRDLCAELKELLLTEEAASHKSREYLGMSAIGHPCDKKLWIEYHEKHKRELDARGYLAIYDGHRHEEVMADWLSKLPNVEITGRQIELTDFDGMIKGHIDGIIVIDDVGYVWEHKQVNEEKYSRFERQTLQEWDGIYYAQAQLYMHYTAIHRHLLTCGTPGLRDFQQKVTEFHGAQTFIDKAEYIVGSRIMPEGLRKGHYMCNWCDFKDRCWG